MKNFVATDGTPVCCGSAGRRGPRSRRGHEAEEPLEPAGNPPPHVGGYARRKFFARTASRVRAGNVFRGGFGDFISRAAQNCFSASALLAIVLAGAGCQNSSAPPPSPPAERAPAGRAQPKLQTLKLWIGPHEMITELALTPAQKQAGMMFRTNMAEMEGMLFVFPQAHQASFWMRNTTLPLSAAYIDPEGAIVEIRELEPLNETSVTARSDNIQYVLETNRGWFERNKIGPGVLIRTERGTLRETFFGKQ
jgi:uncharacterized membrane protein (UPF0127 family)